MEFEQRTLKFTLSKSKKKEDFGIVLGCRFYIKEIRNPKLAEKVYPLISYSNEEIPFRTPD